VESQQRIEQIVVIAFLVILAVGCIAVLRPFLSALLWALILSYSSWPLYAWVVRRLGGRRTLAASVMTLLVAAIFILPLPPLVQAWPTASRKSAAWSRCCSGKDRLVLPPGWRSCPSSVRN
jgi:hypothetical protein